MFSSFTLTHYSWYFDCVAAIILKRLQTKAHHQLKLYNEKNAQEIFKHLLLPQSKDGSIKYYRYVENCRSRYKF